MKNRAFRNKNLYKCGTEDFFLWKTDEDNIKNCTFASRYGTVAEWLGIGLQNRVQRFDSARYLKVGEVTRKLLSPSFEIRRRMFKTTQRNVLCLSVCLCSLLGAASAQVKVCPDPGVAGLVERQQAIVASLPGKSMGYRVQIYFSSGNNSREQANRIRSEFVSKYPKVSVYVLFKEPNFQVQAGDFRTRAEAVRFLREIEPSFPQSFVIKDEIAYIPHEYRKE